MTLRRFQFSLRALLQTAATVGLLLALYGLGGSARLAYAKLILYPVLFLPLLVLFLLPVGAFAYKLGQCLLGRLPPDDLADTEPIRFDSPEPRDDD